MSITVAGATALGAGIAATSGLFGNLINAGIARENRQSQEMMNAQNIAFQQHENQITREREDNAFQRAASDLTAAGLSKTLAAGQPASSQSLTAPSVQAPQLSYRYESALAKMNMAQVMQNMVEKDKQLKMQDELNQANIANINAQTHGQELSNAVFMENHKNEQLLRLSQISQNNAQVAVLRAEENLKRVDLEYRRDELIASIDNKIASTLNFNADSKLSEKQVEYYAQNIAESIARTEKLSKEQELVIVDITRAKLDHDVTLHNLEVARRFGLPVGSVPSGLIGSALTSGYSLKNLMLTKNNSLANLFNLGTHSHSTGSGGGYAW